jgi:hypothetical protein
MPDMRRLGAFCLVTNNTLHVRLADYAMISAIVRAVTVAVTIPHKLPCVLRRGFIRKNFRINPL